MCPPPLIKRAFDCPMLPRGLQVKGGGSAPLLHAGETPPGVLHPCLRFSVQDKHGHVTAGPEEGHENDQRDGTPLL